MLNETYMLIHLLTKLTVAVNPINEKSMKKIWSYPVIYSLQIQCKNIHCNSVNDNNWPLIINCAVNVLITVVHRVFSQKNFFWDWYVL